MAEEEGKRNVEGGVRLIWVLSTGHFPSPHLPVKQNVLRSVEHQTGSDLLKTNACEIYIQVVYS